VTHQNISTNRRHLEAVLEQKCQDVRALVAEIAKENPLVLKDGYAAYTREQAVRVNAAYDEVKAARRAIDPPQLWELKQDEVIKIHQEIILDDPYWNRVDRSSLSAEQRARLESAEAEATKFYNAAHPPEQPAPSNILPFPGPAAPAPMMPVPAPPTVVQPPPISATRFKWIDPATLPKDKWLYGYFLQRGYVSLTVATGGTGKSVLSIAESLAMISGRTLLHDVAHEKLRVWLVNLEDPLDLLQKRVTAAALHYGIPPEDIEAGLFMDSGRDREVKIAVSSRDGALIVEPVYEAIVATIKANKIDVVIIDPFVSSHSVSENDNVAIDLVVKRWSKVAHVTGCAVQLIHHTRKAGGEAVGVEHSRGASALNDGARASRTLNVMSSEEAGKAGITNPYAYVRIDDAKRNLAPRSERSVWFRIDSHMLPNGDNAPVVTKWEWPNPMDNVTADEFTRVWDAIGDEEWRADSRSARWVGNVIAGALGIDLADKPSRERVKEMIRGWLKCEALLSKSGADEYRTPRTFIYSGRPKPPPVPQLPSSGVPFPPAPHLPMPPPSENKN
jgi:hypothetical protein